ncbi:MAG: CBS domain-containing protein [Candidatus Nanopelagicales bacterium]|jgi:Mg/Co/Ni transporter MgtE|nr:magnesium transporter [Actinomycetota bacterium]NCG02067.1 CBS domain-containing protein [Actinomycetales bacterium]MBT5501382.1 magnesium transporter [Actinomycetota bacterium]MBT5807013.1 magnesium transporter [Actinomycetota bacterium]MDA9017423.1 CBS domain-containing protein [Actinomycetota bacterium]
MLFWEPVKGYPSPVSTNPRVFLARLNSLGVFDPNGDQMGKVRDAIVVLRTGNLPARLTGLVVEVPPRRRIFVPMTKVTTIDSGQIIVTGTVNLRRFEQRKNETLVTAELLDRTVELQASGEPVTVIDVGVEQSRSREWFVDQLFVRRATQGFRRRSEKMVVDWNDVTNMSLPVPDQPAEQLLATMDSLRPADVASMLRELTPTRRTEIARELDDERLADVLEEMTDQNRVEILEALEAERAADILEEMDPDDAADLIAELAPERAKDLLERMEPEEADDIRRLLSYDDFSAGGMMTSEPIVLAPDETVADALARIRNADLSPALASQVYVCRQPTETPTGKYLGVCHFQRLLREPPSSLVSALLDTSLEPMRPDTPLSVLTRSFAAYNLVALPVVDETGSLVGAVTFDDLVDHMLPQGWRELPDGWGHDDPVMHRD